MKYFFLRKFYEIKKRNKMIALLKYDLKFKDFTYKTFLISCLLFLISGTTLQITLLNREQAFIWSCNSNNWRILNNQMLSAEPCK